MMLALAFAVLPGCEIDINGLDRDIDVVVSEPFSFELQREGRTRVRITGINGEIRVAGDESLDAVVVDGMKRVGSDSRRDAQRWLDRIEVETAMGGEAIAIETRHPHDTDGREVVVDYEIRVPIDLQVSVHHVNGAVEIRSLDAAVEVDHVNGDVDLFDIFGDADVVLVNGQVDAEVYLPFAGLIDIRLTNGDVNLDVPAETSADLDARVTNGTVTVSNLTLHDPVVNTRSVIATLGGGDGLIELRTVNGTIRVIGF